MPYLRRQPNSHDLAANDNSNTTSSLRALFQTAPSRYGSSNPTRQLTTSTGAHGLTPDPAPIMPPAGSTNPFSIFGRRPPEEPQSFSAEEDDDEDEDYDDDEFDDGYDPNVQNTEQTEAYDERTGQANAMEEGIDDSGVVDDEDLEEGIQGQLGEDGTEEMHDLGICSPCKPL